MGLKKWASKTWKSTKKAVKKTAKAVVKTVKTVTKPITKIVKTVAKSVVDVGKSIVKGVKSAVKTVGKSLSKLGPLASIALMAIPGFQAFGASLASGLGFSSTLAANMATGAMTGFITSGGNLKAALVGGAMAGAGSYLGDVAQGAWNSTGSIGDRLATGFAQANTAAMAPNAFTGGLTGMQGFSAGMDAAATEWGNFTNKVGDLFSSQSPTGSIAEGAAATTSTFDKYGMSPTEYMEVYGKVPDTAIGMTKETADMFTSGQITPQQAMDKAAAGDWTQQAQMLAEQNAAFGADGGVQFNQMMLETTPTELAAGPLFGAPELVKEQFNASMKAMGIDPNSQQAQMLAEQQFGATMPDMTKTAGEWNYAPYDTSGDLAFTDWEDFTSLVQSGEGGTPVYMAKDYKEPTASTKSFDPTSLLSGSGGTGVTQAPYVTSVSPIDISLKGAGAVGGAGGMLGFSDVQRQTQAQLIAQAERQAEIARQRASKGWSLA
jgi:hypothetical protein